MTHRAGARTLAAHFDARNNSLNALRLIFALLVVVGHAGHLGFGVAGFGEPGVTVDRFAPSEVAVDGFFVVSGFLITRSRVGAGPGGGRAYLWKRFLRIVPGYWACLAVTAFVVTPIAWLHEYGSLRHFFSLSGAGPLGFVVKNMTFVVRQSTIAGAFGHSHLPGQVNGSIWTLFFEVAAYVAVAVLGAAGLLRARHWIAPASVVALFAVLLRSDLGAGAAQTGVVYEAARLGLFFAIGMTLYLWGDRVPVTAPLAAAAALCWLASPWLVGPAVGRDWQLVGAVPFAYLTMWLALRLPLRGVGRTRDLSYGVYLYSWPIQQLLTLWGVPGHGWLAYSAVSVAASLVAALASWHLVEAPALRWKNAPASRRPVSSAQPVVATPG